MKSYKSLTKSVPIWINIEQISATRAASGLNWDSCAAIDDPIITDIDDGSSLIAIKDLESFGLPRAPRLPIKPISVLLPQSSKVKSISIRLGEEIIISGSYFFLKRFIDAVEKLPRFLVVEKIDFLDTSVDGSFLALKINLAGYYAL